MEESEHTKFEFSLAEGTDNTELSDSTAPSCHPFDVQIYYRG